MGRREGIRGGTRRASLCLHAKRRLLQKGSGVRCGAAIWATALHESVQGISVEDTRHALRVQGAPRAALVPKPRVRKAAFLRAAPPRPPARA